MRGMRALSGSWRTSGEGGSSMCGMCVWGSYPDTIHEEDCR